LGFFLTASDSLATVEANGAARTGDAGESVRCVQRVLEGTPIEIHVSHAERLDKRGYFIQEINDRGNGKGSGIVMGTGDNCLCFIP